MYITVLILTGILRKGTIVLILQLRKFPKNVSDGASEGKTGFKPAMRGMNHRSLI